MRTSESKGHWQVYGSSAPFEPEVRKSNWQHGCANFGFGALVFDEPFQPRQRDVPPARTIAHHERGESEPPSPACPPAQGRGHAGYSRNPVRCQSHRPHIGSKRAHAGAGAKGELTPKRERAPCVTHSSSATRVNLSCRAAVSKALTAFRAARRRNNRKPFMRKAKAGRRNHALGAT